MYKATDKMCDLMGASGHNECFENQVLQLLNRFGLPFGVGDKTIEAVCKENDVDTATLLAVVNFAIEDRHHHTDEAIDIPTLRRYLENAHTYFLDFQLPRIRQELIEAINMAEGDTKIPLLIIQFFDEYVQEIRSHIQHENDHSFEHHATDDQHITAKAIELKNLIIKYYPHAPGRASNKTLEQNRMLYAALHDIYHFESELALHCAIEDEIMIPAIAQHEKSQACNAKAKDDIETEELSAREKEVLIQVVKGLSNKEIADVLCLSAHTVMSHRKNIARKLNIHSTAGLTIYAIVNGIVNIENLES